MTRQELVQNRAFARAHAQRVNVGNLQDDNEDTVRYVVSAVIFLVIFAAVVL